MSVSEQVRVGAGFGVDVSKNKLDVALWQGGNKFRWRKFDNNAAGFAALVAWARKITCEQGAEIEARFCMESTGDYGVALALYLTEIGIFVSVVNPARIKDFGMGEGRLTKTDKADAKTIAQYAATHDLAPWAMQDPGRRSIFRLFRRRDQLITMIGAEDNRRECPEAIGADCMDSIKATLKALRAELRAIEAKLEECIAQTPRLERDAALLRSIGLGSGSIFLILADMPPVEEVPAAASYAATAGVQPTCKSSGLRQPESSPMSRAGRRNVRRALWMATFCIKGKLPELADLYDRLRKRGRKHKQAMIACMRKLLMIVYGVLKSGKPYECRRKDLDAISA